MYKPNWAGPIQGWTVRYSHQHFWRVADTMQWEDVMQEAYLVFMRCSNRYPVTDTPQHFMALYKRAWINHMNDLSNGSSNQKTEISDQVMTDDGPSTIDQVGSLDNDGYLRVLVNEAPEEVRMVLALLVNAPQELIDLAMSGWNGPDRRKKANGSQRICQMLGIPQHIDVMGMVREYFTH